MKIKCGGYQPVFFQQKWLAQAREAEAASQAPLFAQLAALVAIPAQ